ncbi:MAG: alpha/beta hydrolase [Proteobacteria bacterium]|nr:alpha/beta hydrolase [Pseudomonadota bacterium]
MPKALVNGVRLHYLQVGDATARENLVMVHGLASNLAFWYFQYAPEFSKRFRVTLLDLRGHGGSDVTPSGYKPADLSLDVSGLLDHLGIAEAHFIAHSFGGLVALHHARRHPGAVRSLVLADSHVPGLLGVRTTPGTWARGQVIRPVLQRYGIDLDTDNPHFGFRLLGVMAKLRLSEQPVPEELMGLFGPVMVKFGRHTAAQWLKLLSTTTAEADFLDGGSLEDDELRKFDFPIFAIYGDSSHARRTGDELCKVWPQAEFQLMRGAGHFFPVSRTEELIGLCNSFWESIENEPRNVRRPNDTRAYFQSDRFYMIDDGWYCSLREGGRLGPFGSREEAATQLAAVLAAM